MSRVSRYRLGATVISKSTTTTYSLSENLNSKRSSALKRASEHATPACFESFKLSVTYNHHVRVMVHPGQVSIDPHKPPKSPFVFIVIVRGSLQVMWFMKGSRLSVDLSVTLTTLGRNVYKGS